MVLSLDSLSLLLLFLLFVVVIFLTVGNCFDTFPIGCSKCDCFMLVITDPESHHDLLKAVVCSPYDLSTFYRLTLFQCHLNRLVISGNEFMAMNAHNLFLLGFCEGYH